MKVIDSFEGEFEFLSNFSEIPLFIAGFCVPTVEHFFQAHKLGTKSDEMFYEILRAETPGKAKRLGRKCKLRDDWESVKDTIMYYALCKKFQYQDLKKKLLATGDALLIEGNTWHDNYWGDCKCEKCKDIRGENKLGQLLMRVREELKPIKK